MHDSLVLFSGHRQVNALGPIIAARPNVFRESCVRAIVATPKQTYANPRFPSSAEMQRGVGEDVWSDLCTEAHYGNSETIREQVPEDLLQIALPKTWIHSAKHAGASCAAGEHLMHFQVPALRLHALRHAFAHAGGWHALSSSDRLKAAYAVTQRLSSEDRIRFAYAEHASHPAERIREYWAELLAFAFGITAARESEWRRAFLARAVQRCAGAPCAYPSSQTGEGDLALVRWYLDRVSIKEPWAYAAGAAEWLKRSEEESRLSRIRHAISGFPPGKIRMIFSALLQSETAFADRPKNIPRPESEVSPNVITWVEQACAFADDLASLKGRDESSGLLSKSAELTAALQLFSESERRQAIDAIHRYIEALMNSV